MTGRTTSRVRVATRYNVFILLTSLSVLAAEAAAASALSARPLKNGSIHALGRSCGRSPELARSYGVQGPRSPRGVGWRPSCAAWWREATCIAGNPADPGKYSRGSGPTYRPHLVR